MNTHTKKQQWKLLLFLIAIVIGVSSLWYTDQLVRKLSDEERKKVVLLAEAMREVAATEGAEIDFSLVVKVMQYNETVPVILLSNEGQINSWRNMSFPDSKDPFIEGTYYDSLTVYNQLFLQKQLTRMRSRNDSIKVRISDSARNYIFYSDSHLLSQLYYYPLIQLGVITLFISVSYLAFSSSRKAEQNQVWVGLSKETAHQLGTPISSLVAWVELLKLREQDMEMVKEVEKDVNRLETITERFSKIGSAPELVPANVVEVLQHSVDYMRKRSSNRVKLNLHFEQSLIMAPVNVALFEWVVENLCKNAVDAIEGQGTVDLYVQDQGNMVVIDVQDSGKGIPKSKQKTVFEPGYTTKKRGWGLGLSLVKRIVEEYHDGKIVVKSSVVNKGTTFRVLLKK